MMPTILKGKEEGEKAGVDWPKWDEMKKDRGFNDPRKQKWIYGGESFGGVNFF